MHPRSLRRLQILLKRKTNHNSKFLDPSINPDQRPWTLPLLQRSLGLPPIDSKTVPTTYKHAPVDPLLVSIDCEFITHGNSDTIREIGISTLDTQRLKTLSSSSKISEFQNMIQTFNFTFSNLKKAKNRRLPRVFGFDHQIKTSKSELRQVLHEFTTTSYDACSPRNILLVGHGFRVDLQLLTREDFHLPNVEVLDTASLANQLFSSSQKLKALDIELAKGLKGTFSLRRLVSKLGIPSRERLFHNAGNDSHMTMRLLLQLGVESAASTCQTAEHQSRVSVLRAIANSPLEKLSIYEESFFDHKQLQKIDTRRDIYVQQLARGEADSLKSKSFTNTTPLATPINTETTPVSRTHTKMPQNYTQVQLELSSSFSQGSDPSRPASSARLNPSDTSNAAPSVSSAKSNKTVPETATSDLGAAPCEDQSAIQQGVPTLMTARAARNGQVP